MNDTIHMRVDPELKSDAEAILNSLGLSTTDAIKMFLKQIILNDGIPFEVKRPKPNAETLAAIKEAEALAKDKNAKTYDSVDELFKELDEYAANEND